MGSQKEGGREAMRNYIDWWNKGRWFYGVPWNWVRGLFNGYEYEKKVEEHKKAVCLDPLNCPIHMKCVFD